jgi:hypothetical protein
MGLHVFPKWMLLPDPNFSGKKVTKESAVAVACMEKDAHGDSSNRGVQLKNRISVAHPCGNDFFTIVLRTVPGEMLFFVVVAGTQFINLG